MRSGLALDLNLANGMPFQRAEYEAQADLEVIADFAVAEDQEPLVYPSSPQFGAHRFLEQMSADCSPRTILPKLNSRESCSIR